MSQINKELRKIKLKEKCTKCWYGFWERLGKLVSPTYLKIQDKKQNHYKDINNYDLDRIAKKSYSKFCRMLVADGIDDKMYFVRNTEYMNNSCDSCIVNIYDVISTINNKESKNFIRYFWRRKPMNEVEERFINLIEKDITLNTKAVSLKDMGITIFSESYSCLKNKIILEVTVNKDVIF